MFTVVYLIHTNYNEFIIYLKVKWGKCRLGFVKLDIKLVHIQFLREILLFLLMVYLIGRHSTFLQNNTEFYVVLINLYFP